MAVILVSITPGNALMPYSIIPLLIRCRFIINELQKNTPQSIFSRNELVIQKRRGTEELRWQPVSPPLPIAVTMKFTGLRTVADKTHIGPIDLLCKIMYDISKIMSKFILSLVKAHKFLWWLPLASQLNGSVQDCSNCIANALELLQSCSEPWNWSGLMLLDSPSGDCHWLDNLMA